MGQSEVIPQSNCLLSTLSSCPPPLLLPPIRPGTSVSTGKTCGSWQALQLEKGHGTTLSAQLQISSHQDQMEESGELGCAMKEQASGNMSGKIEGRKDSE
ncbi:hypothetical protein ABVT39_024404 [Epinephelus coioides]